MQDSPFTTVSYGEVQTKDPSADSVFTPVSYGASDNPHIKAAQNLSGNQDFNGLCEAFVEKVAGTPNMGRTAAEAWNNWLSQGKAYGDPEKAPAGSIIYFAPDSSNENAGHTALADGKGNIIGATDNGVKTHSLKEWQAATGQKPLGFVIP